MADETREKQYQAHVSLRDTKGLTRLGLRANAAWHADPKRLGIVLSRYKFVAKMLADMAMRTEAARWLVYAAAVAAEKGSPDTPKMAAMAKCFATDVAMEVATDAVQVFGGYGFMEDYPIAKCFRDAKILQIYEGTNQIQRIVIARHMIKEIQALEHLKQYIPTETQKSYGVAPVAT